MLKIRHDMVEVVGGFLSRDECNELISIFNESTDIAEATFNSDKGRISNEKVRKSDLLWVPFDQLNWLKSKVYSFIDPKLSPSDSVQLTRYIEGGHYTWHPDYYAGNPRKVSLVIPLNDGYEGGEFEFKDVRAPDLSVGDALFFDSKLWHRVKPVSKGVRYSLVMWFL